MYHKSHYRQYLVSVNCLSCNGMFVLISTAALITTDTVHRTDRHRTVCVQLPTVADADNVAVALHAFAAALHAAAHAVQQLSLTVRTHSSKPAARYCSG